MCVKLLNCIEFNDVRAWDMIAFQVVSFTPFLIYAYIYIYNIDILYMCIYNIDILSNRIIIIFILALAHVLRQKYVQTLVKSNIISNYPYV